jgi:hypothetical protein
MGLGWLVWGWPKPPQALGGGPATLKRPNLFFYFYIFLYIHLMAKKMFWAGWEEEIMKKLKGKMGILVSF